MIIDVFAKVRGTPHPGSPPMISGLRGHVTDQAHRDHYGVAVLLVHHVRKAGAEDFLATVSPDFRSCICGSPVSGTNGLAGAADAVLVLERARAQADGILHVTGRDVDETDYALAFDPRAGAWRLRRPRVGLPHPRHPLPRAAPPARLPRPAPQTDRRRPAPRPRHHPADLPAHGRGRAAPRDTRWRLLPGRHPWLQ